MDENHQIKYPDIDDFIKYILENKVDYGDRDARLFRQYIENRVIRKVL